MDSKYQPQNHFKSPHTLLSINQTNHQNPTFNSLYPILSTKDSLNQALIPPIISRGSLSDQRNSMLSKSECNIRIKELEEKIEHGWFFAYRIWLWLLAVVNTLVLSYMIFLFIAFINLTEIEGLGLVLILLFISSLILYFCWMELKAITSKDLNAAVSGLSIIFILAFSSAVTGLTLIFVVVLLPEMLTWEGIKFFVLNFVIEYIVLMSMNLLGATKVCKALEEIEALSFQTNNSFIS